MQTNYPDPDVEKLYTAAEVAELRAERDGYLQQLQDDPLAKEIAELKAQCAAMLEKAAKVAGPYSILAGIAIRALIPTDSAAALEEVKRQERLEALTDIQGFSSGDYAGTHSGRVYFVDVEWLLSKMAALRAEGAKQP